jgi:hypothetical protein
MQDPASIGPSAEVELRKPHACGANRWRVLRTGADLRLQCTHCGRSLLLPRAEFNKALRKILRPASDGDAPSS